MSADGAVAGFAPRYQRVAIINRELVSPAQCMRLLLPMLWDDAVAVLFVTLVIIGRGGGASARSPENGLYCSRACAVVIFTVAGFNAGLPSGIRH